MEKEEYQVSDIQKEGYETRIILLAIGIEAHDEDLYKQREQMSEKAEKKANLKTIYERNYEPYYLPTLDYLKRKFGEDFEIETDKDKIKQILSQLKIDLFTNVLKVGKYTSEHQKVKYVIATVTSKKDYKKALEIEEPQLHVIYDGHSRYGRGTCFDTYTDVAIDNPKHEEGKQWESGNSADNGLFRLGYTYVPVSLEDIKHHKYPFAPIAVEEGPPPNENKPPFSRHPHARRSLRKTSLPEELQQFVLAPYKSPSNQYYGLTAENEESVLFHAGWTKTTNDPYDLGATDLKCKVFCHFGCSSQLHYWEIVRKDGYKGWSRPKPPTDRYAYFTTAPSDARATPLWLFYLLSYEKENDFQPWWDSLEAAKKKANNKLRSIGAGFEFY